jgi:hypothetical protein
MNVSKRSFTTIAAALASTLLTGGAVARAADPAPATAPQPTEQELQQKLQELQGRLQQLESQQEQQQSQQDITTATSTDDTVARVLDDANRRSQLMQLDEGFTAGFTNGRFVIGTADGNFTFMPAVQLQFRNITNFNTDGDDSLENGFEIRRAKFGFDGKAFTKDLDYYFLWATSSTTGGVSLEQAWVRYKVLPRCKALAAPPGSSWTRRFTSRTCRPSGSLTNERTLLVQILASTGESFTQGVEAIWEPDHFRFELGFTDGINTGNSSFRDFPTGPTDFGVVGRAEFYVMGDVKQYEDFTARGNKNPVLVFGAGADWTQIGDTDDLTHTVDAQFETTWGLALYAAYEGQFLHNGAGHGFDRNHQRGRRHL